MRNSMGSWIFVFGALVFLAIWMAFNNNKGFDKYPFILLNLVLSCLAAMQGAILLIAAKRSDQISAELAQHDYETDQAALAELKANTELTKAIHEQSTQIAEQGQRIEDLSQQVAALIGVRRTT